jgi:putative ABC transport system permease protein
MYFIAYKSLFRRKFRTALAVFGVMLGVLLIFVMGSLSQSGELLTEDLKNVLGTDTEVLPEEGEMDKDVVDVIESIPGVECVAPRVTAFVKIKGIKLLPVRLGEMEIPEEMMGMISGTSLIGISPSSEMELGTYQSCIIEGAMFEEGDAGLAVVGIDFAEQADMGVGDEITIIFDRDRDGVDRKDEHDFEIMGIFEFGSIIEDSKILTSLEDAQEIRGFSSSEISSLIVRTEPGLENDVAVEIRTLVDDVSVVVRKDIIESIEEMSSRVTEMILLMGVFAGVVGFVFILVVMVMSILERTKEIGVLRATGWYKSDVLKLIMFESVLISLVGTACAVGIGVLILEVLVPSLMPGVELLLKLTPSMFAIAIIFGLGIGVSAGIYPAYRAANMDPIEAFRGGE